MIFSKNYSLQSGSKFILNKSFCPFKLAPVKQLIMEKLPMQARIHQQSKELISTLCMQFLMQLAEEANEFCSA